MTRNPSSAAEMAGVGRPPPLVDRLIVRKRPAEICVGHQRWNHLLFAHWSCDPAAVQSTLPLGLTVDTFGGAAYVGIVPFFIQRVRPSWLPPLPGISWFLELNVRTYVYDRAGRPGVWFYSLDCNQPLAVFIARRFFHLPYFHARMTAQRDGDTMRFTSERRGTPATASRYAWRCSQATATARPGSLEFFLVERYLLFTTDREGHLWAGSVHHSPYQIGNPLVAECSVAPALQAGFDLAGEPASVLTAQPVDVSIFPLRPVPNRPA